MANMLEKEPVEAPTGQRTAAGDDTPANDADMALAAMGYKPVSPSVRSSPALAQVKGCSSCIEP